MRVLLDTHVLLWWVIDSDRLSKHARDLLLDVGNELYWSAASSWELAIKFRLGRLTLPAPPRVTIPKILRDQSIRSLDITQDHALATADLPDHHRDPFDRLLAAQARIEKLRLLSADPVFSKYRVRRVW